MSWLWGKKRRKGGFTLSEMMIAVGITATLLALSMPALSGLSQELKMTELDDTARSIYVEAQNRLTSMKASGQLEEFRDMLEDEQSGFFTLGQLDQVAREEQLEWIYRPHDYLDQDDKWEGLYYAVSGLTSHAPLFDYLLGPGIMSSALAGSYILEFDPATGDVYSVFYAQRLITYDDVLRLVNRTWEERAPEKIGYYRGNLDSSVVQYIQVGQQLDLINGEELYARLTYDMSQIWSYRNYLSIIVTVADQHGAVMTSRTYSGSELDINSNFTGELYILLDSMETGNDIASLGINRDFTQTAGEGGLTAGDDLTVTAVCDFNLQGYAWHEEDNATANSLFAARSGQDGQEISVSYVRHLHNLRQDIFDYQGEEPLEVTQVVTAAAQNIDFANNSNFHWDGDEYRGPGGSANPLTSFEPIHQPALAGGSFAGAGLDHALANFIISDGDNVGLFASVSDAAFRNTFLVDPQVVGGGASGALAGSLTNCTVDNCGVFLTTRNANGLYVNQDAADEEQYQDMMSQRVDTYTVSGNGAVGGLVGTAANTTFTRSFAAIQVLNGGAGGSGGLVGYMNGGSMSGCYASGDVRAERNAGGLVGQMLGGSVSGSYSTSDIFADQQAGGIAGLLNGGSISDSRYYGLLRHYNGDPLEQTQADRNEFGGIVGGAGNNSGVGAECYYLRQAGYNSGGTVNGLGTSRNYNDLRAEEEQRLAASNSHPYSPELTGASFPFRPVLAQHYGDWPALFSIEAALVYYEKYDATSYGFYCETNLTAGETVYDELGNVVAVQSGKWVMDTLEDRIVIEDGYALMSIYDLNSFDYRVNGADEDNDPYLTLTRGPAVGNTTFARMSNLGELVFNYYIGEITGDSQSIDDFSASRLYFYQLPFDLQMPDRDMQGTFYDKLEITNGLSILPGQEAAPVIEEVYGFYYNGHFAKNAINPQPDEPDNQAVYPPDPARVAVRSARQLNCLGRYYYYWNPENSHMSNVTFVQGTDISFSAYTDDYCGHSYDLMNTDYTNTYRNQPIGRPAGQIFFDVTPSRFMNSYDGQRYQIIDYRVSMVGDDECQFTGLFGEIGNGSTLQNIIMTTDPNGAEPGYIKSVYTQRKSPGAGALVGLAYIEDGRALMENCAVSGYEVSLKHNGAANDGSSAAVGGLVGFNMGTISKCSAVSSLVMADIRAGNEVNTSVGGLVGSNHYNISNSYAGGNLLISGNLGGQKAIGGLVGPSVPLSGASTTPASINNCYSFSVLDPAASAIIEGDTFNMAADVTFYGVAGDRSGGGSMPSSVSISGCYYLADTVAQGTTVQTVSGGAAEYSYANMMAAGGNVTEEHSYPWSDELDGLPYPFAAVVTDRQGLAHYGDWPLPKVGQLVYYERYTDNSYGLYFPDGEGGAMEDYIDTLDYANAKTIAAAGYGFLLNEGAAVSQIPALSIAGYEWDTWDILDPDAALTGVISGEYSGAIYPLSYYAAQALRGGLLSGQAIVVGQGQTETFYINSDFAAAISSQQYKLSAAEATPLQVRTASQLEQVGAYNWNDLAQGAAGAWFRQTHDIDLWGYQGYDSWDLDAAFHYTGHYLDGNNNDSQMLISNASRPIFAINSGEISWVRIRAAAIEYQEDQIGQTGAALAISNNGDGSGNIHHCTVEGSVVNFPQAAALVGVNNATIANCTVSGNTISSPEGLAGGLAAVNTGDIEDCSVEGDSVTAGSVIANYGRAGGLAAENRSTGSIVDCSVSGVAITASNGSAGGLAAGNSRENNAIPTLDNVSVSGVVINARIAAGLAAENSGDISNAQVGGNDTRITGDFLAMGLAAEMTSGSVSYSAVSDATVTATGEGGASGFLGVVSGGAVSDCSVLGPVSVSSVSGLAAGFVLTNTLAAISDCGVAGGDNWAASISGSQAAGFAHTNSGVISDCYVRADNDYARVTVNGYSQAAGFACYANGEISACYGVATVNGGSAAGFASAGLGHVINSYANCQVNATANGIAAGFAGGGELNIDQCYAAGRVSADIGVAAGFALAGAAEDCYTIAELVGNEGATLYGFGQAVVGGTCYWARETGDDPYNSEVPNDGSGTAATLRTIANASFPGMTASGEWDDDGRPYSALGTNYLYPLPNNIATHYGDWPELREEEQPVTGRSGYIGVAEVFKKNNSGHPDSYTRTFTYYDAFWHIIIPNSTNGPAITWQGGSNSTRLYLYYSNDLNPSYVNENNIENWHKVFSATLYMGSKATQGDYSYYQIQTGGISENTTSMNMRLDANYVDLCRFYFSKTDGIWHLYSAETIPLLQVQP